MAPEQQGRFARDRMFDDHMVLPDLLDDMDITQKLAVELVGGVVADLNLPDAIRDEIGIVLAMAGKTERGVEATMRVLAPRFKRVLSGSDRHAAKLDLALDETVPSGGSSP